MDETLARAPRVRTVERSSIEEERPFTAESLIRAAGSSTRPREVPRRALAGAVGSWFALIFALCYVALPTTAAALGLYDGALRSLPANTVAFVPLALLTTALVAAIRPAVITSTRAPRDPVISAAIGSLLVWFLGHEALLALQPITEMPLTESVTFTGINLVEHGLFGMMLGSFVRSPIQAFALGAAFQAMFLSLFVGWII